MTRRLLLSILLLPSAALCSEFTRLMGETYHGDRRKRIPALVSAIKAWAPTDSEDELTAALCKIGVDLIDEDRMEDARSFLEVGLKRRPQDICLLTWHAEALVQLGLNPQALPGMKRLRKIAPDDANVLFHDCSLRLSLELYAEALPLCERLARGIGPSREGHQQLAVAYVHAGRVEQAEEALAVSQTAPTLAHIGEPDRPKLGATADVTAAIVYGWGRDPERALGLLEKTMEAYPGLLRVTNVRGRLYHHLGRYEAAIRDFDLVIQHGPRYIDAYYFRAKAHEKAGRPELAARDRAEACRRGWTPACPVKKARR